TEIRTKKELAAVLSSSSSSSSSSSGSNSFTDSVFTRIGSWVGQWVSSFSSSSSSSSYSENAVFNETPVAVKMYEDRDQVRYGFILYGVKGELNREAPETYDSVENNLLFSTVQEALSNCSVVLTHLYGFEHTGKCKAYQNWAGQFGFQIEAKPKFK